MSETYDVAVIGAGLAGMSASVFAANRGLRVVQVGNAGALLFSSGLLDLLGVHPIEEGHAWGDPWAGLAVLISSLLWLFYLALEPYVPRLRPWTLVSWTRLLNGGTRDAVVGRDVLIGLAWGTGLALLVVLARALVVVPRPARAAV